VPAYTDDTGRWFTTVERAYYTNASTVSYNISTTQYWNALDQYQSTGGSTLVANSPYVIDDWRAWNTSTCTTITQNTYYPALETWQDWCTTGTVISNGSYQSNVPTREPTPEELATAQKAALEREAKRAKAKVRAKSLLDSVLSPEQRQYMDRHGYIPVVGSKGRRYHVRTTGGASGNVAVLDDKDQVTGRFCAHPGPTHDGHSLPNEDQFLAQVLHLQDDEDEFLRVANLVEGKNPVRGLALVG
jgi:hypothetical protein